MLAEFNRDWLDKTIARADMLGIQYRKVLCIGGYVYIFEYRDGGLVDLELGRHIPIEYNREYLIYLDENVSSTFSVGSSEDELIKLIAKLPHCNVKVVGGGNKLISLSRMFSNCELSIIDLTELHTPNLESMQSMFTSCYTSELKFGDKFISENVSNIDFMFYNAHIDSVDFHKLKFKKLDKLDATFYNFKCRGYFNKSCDGRVLNLSNLNIKYNQKKIKSLFGHAYFAILDISGFRFEQKSDILTLLSTAFSFDKIVIDPVYAKFVKNTSYEKYIMYKDTGVRRVDISCDQ